jgi:lipopolysaccharide/colanic/teichoic acid biosynthesis glycosyltransferase
VLFRQRREGCNGVMFTMYKFRTLYAEFEDAAASQLVKRRDERVTAAGRVLRRLSLDELPQLINVLRGDMSLVGPRPHAPGARAGDRPYCEVVARYWQRCRVRPGMTGLAQVNGWRGETDTVDKIVRRVECDLRYIENWSYWLDLKIMAKTPVAIIAGRNSF